MNNKKSPKVPKGGEKSSSKVAEYFRNDKFYCDDCNYSTHKTSNFKKHFNSNKHKKVNKVIYNPASFFPSFPPEFPKVARMQWVCEICDKSFNSKSPYYRHKNKCEKSSSKVAKLGKIQKSEPVLKIKEDYLKLLAEKKEAELEKEKANTRADKAEKENMKLEIKYLKKTVDILQTNVGKPGTSNSHNNTTNSHNTNHISINMYLSEHCQDAMNLDDFVNKIKFKLKDVFDGNLPIENPVQKVFIQKLEDLDPTKRPVHCTDTRRGKFMVNDKNEGWIEDTGAKIAAGVKRVQSKAFVDAFQAFDAEYKPPHPGKIQDKKDSIVNPIRNNVTQKGTNKIIKEVANAMNIKDAISQLEKEPKSKDDL